MKLDVTVELTDIWRMPAKRLPCLLQKSQQQRLMDCARNSLAGLAIVRPGVRAYEIGEAIQKEGGRDFRLFVS